MANLGHWCPDGSTTKSQLVSAVYVYCKFAAVSYFCNNSGRWVDAQFLLRYRKTFWRQMMLLVRTVMVRLWMFNFTKSGPVYKSIAALATKRRGIDSFCWFSVRLVLMFGTRRFCPIFLLKMSLDWSRPPPFVDTIFVTIVSFNRPLVFNFPLTSFIYLVRNFVDASNPLWST